MTTVLLIQLVEVLVLSMALIVTVIGTLMTWSQTRNHFMLERSRGFIERFNSGELLDHRQAVDTWLETGESVPGLLQRVDRDDPDAVAVRLSIRVIANFFQELGVAFRHRTVRAHYVWDVFGSLIKRYWRELSPYIEEVRGRTGRATLFEDFTKLANQMDKLDGRKGLGGDAPAEAAPQAYIFGYGSLIHPGSVAKTLPRRAPQAQLHTVWLNGYRRSWSVYDLVEPRGESSNGRVPLAFLNIEPEVASRCNGVLVPIMTADLRGFDAREKNYKRLLVTSAISPPPDQPVYTYVGKSEYQSLPAGTKVARNYEDLIDSGVQQRGKVFALNFRASTHSHTLPYLTGDYRFLDPDQNRATGR